MAKPTNKPLFEIPCDLSQAEAEKLALHAVRTVNVLCKAYGIGFVSAVAHSGDKVQSYGTASALEALTMVGFIAGDCAKALVDSEPEAGSHAKH